MRKMLLVAAPAVLLGLIDACQSTPIASTPVAGADDPTPIAEAAVTLYVNGMSCPLCANNIDKQLMRVPGVKNVQVDLGNGAVKVELQSDRRATRQALAAAIEKSGFTLVRIDKQ